MLAALADSDPEAAHRLVTDLFSLAGIEPASGCSVAEIAECLLELAMPAAPGAPARQPDETRALIERYLNLNGNPDEVAGELRALAADAKISLNAALDLFETRSGFLAARGVDVGAIRFSTALRRGFDYYTGFVFELHDPRAKQNPLVVGGRYDSLLARLGARATIPAVGFAASVDELAACAGAS